MMRKPSLDNRNFVPALLAIQVVLLVAVIVVLELAGVRGWMDWWGWRWFSTALATLNGYCLGWYACSTREAHKRLMESLDRNPDDRGDA
jgi:hypothetical protein